LADLSLRVDVSDPGDIALLDHVFVSGWTDRAHIHIKLSRTGQKLTLWATSCAVAFDIKKQNGSGGLLREQADSPAKLLMAPSFERVPSGKKDHPHPIQLLEQS
jgi:hypothetical protein